mgnify:FL=1
MNKHDISLLLFLCLSLSSFSQELEEGQVAIDYDNAYIQDYRQRLSLSALFDFQNYFIIVFRKDQSFLRFTSNLLKPKYGINSSYKELNFEVS